MRALVTNDDGIASLGLRALARAALDTGLDVTVAAPSWDSSGASASLTGVEQDGRLLFQRDHSDGWEGMTAFSVEAAPAFIVRAAVHGAFGDPPTSCCRASTMARTAVTLCCTPAPSAPR